MKKQTGITIGYILNVILKFDSIEFHKASCPEAWVDYFNIYVRHMKVISYD